MVLNKVLNILNHYLLGGLGAKILQFIEGSGLLPKSPSILSRISGVSFLTTSTH